MYLNSVDCGSHVELACLHAFKLAFGVTFFPARIQSVIGFDRSTSSACLQRSWISARSCAQLVFSAWSALLEASTTTMRQPKHQTAGGGQTRLEHLW